jgi:hypothetical protein
MRTCTYAAFRYSTRNVITRIRTHARIVQSWATAQYKLSFVYIIVYNIDCVIKRSSFRISPLPYKERICRLSDFADYTMNESVRENTLITYKGYEYPFAPLYLDPYLVILWVMRQKHPLIMSKNHNNAHPVRA